jgi:hypothetical protein
MRLAQGDNHLISSRDGVAICQVWVRPDLSPEEGAKNAREMVSFLMQNALCQGSPFRGLIFDVRRGPPVFGPKTRETLLSLFDAAAKVNIPVAILAGAAPIQLVQFRNLCRESSAKAEVFENEGEAVHWFNTAGKS